MPRLRDHLLWLLLAVPAAAQVHGIPGSAISNAPGHFGGGIPASVTSLGPRGFSVPDGFSAGDTRFSSRPPEFHRGRFPGQHFGPRSRFNYPVAYGYPVYLYDGGYETNVEAQQPVQQEPQRIIVEIRDTREQRAATTSTEQEAIAQKQAAPKVEAAPERPSDPVIVVFLDGHRQSLKDYAIMGGYIYDLSEGSAKKIPLNTVDAAATRKLNEQRGVEFNLPQAAAPASAAPSGPHLTSAR